MVSIEMKEEDLVYGLTIRDPEISSRFYEIYSPIIYRIVLAILGHEQNAEDCTQEVLVKVLKNIHRFKGRSTLKTWVVAIAVNTARTALKRTLKRRKRDISIEKIIFAAPAPGPSPEKQAIRSDERDRLFALLAKLAQPWREILILREMEGLSYEEIRTVLKIPLGTVRSRIARARLALLDLFHEEERDAV